MNEHEQQGAFGSVIEVSRIESWSRTSISLNLEGHQFMVTVLHNRSGLELPDSNSARQVKVELIAPSGRVITLEPTITFRSTETNGAESSELQVHKKLFNLIGSGLVSQWPQMLDPNQALNIISEVLGIELN